MAYLHRLLGRMARDGSAGQDRPRFTPSFPTGWAAIAVEAPDPFTELQEEAPPWATTPSGERDSPAQAPAPPLPPSSPPAPAPMPGRPAPHNSSFRESFMARGREQPASFPLAQPAPPSAESERQPLTRETPRAPAPESPPFRTSGQVDVAGEMAAPSPERADNRPAPEMPPQPLLSPVEPADSASPAPEPPSADDARLEPAVRATLSPPDVDERQERSPRPDPPHREEARPDKTAVQLEPSFSFPETYAHPLAPQNAEPRVVIGRLHVEVVPQAAPAPPPSRRRPARRRSRRLQPADPPKLRFGLGQT